MFYIFDKKAHLEVIQEELHLPVNNQDYFWVKHPLRILNEESLMRMTSKAILRNEGGKLIWEETVHTPFSMEFVIEISADESYPKSMPIVYLRKPDIPPVDDLYINHDMSLRLCSNCRYRRRTPVFYFRNRAVAWCNCFEIFEKSGTWPNTLFRLIYNTKM